MNGFWVGGWEHVIFSADELRAGKKCPVISHLCFGPLETLEYGVLDGKFYFESKILEGIDEGDCIFEIIDKEHFTGVIENEIRLCKEHAPQLFEQVTKRLEDICRELDLDMFQLSN